MKTRISTKRLRESKEFKKLTLIGGHKVYHLEGNAYRHSVLVWRAAQRRFHRDPLMCRVALLHDIGKIYTSVRGGCNDWTYPGHSPKGGEVLEKFIPMDHPDYERIRWYITNHIKPLFWKSRKDAQKLSKTAPPGCTVQNLARLALCDLDGSLATLEVVGGQLELRKLLEEVAR